MALGDAAHSQANLADVAEQDPVGRRDSHPAGAAGEIDRPAVAGQLRVAGVAIASCLPVLAGFEPVGDVGSGDRGIRREAGRAKIQGDEKKRKNLRLGG
jgi:hypothetical protein